MKRNRRKLPNTSAPRSEDPIRIVSGDLSEEEMIKRLPRYTMFCTLHIDTMAEVRAIKRALEIERNISFSVHKIRD
jgi:hypothetical protein